MSQVAIIGAGVMGETLLSGLIRAGRPVGDLLVVVDTDGAIRLTDTYTKSVRSRLP